MDIEPTDLFASQESSQCPLWFFLSSPAGTFGHRHVRPSLAECETVCVSASQANSGSPVQGEGDLFTTVYIHPHMIYIYTFINIH